ncbi:MAG TPA: AAA family ATPase [Tetrasphaera australiensis]|nr:AAA family ATPase [Actinomycetota bacterium]HPF80077.1 AAA family ATPase [Tetrasphaera australiensis]HRW00907.1 AAA family ATPase [Tetrasphaera sp.]
MVPIDVSRETEPERVSLFRVSREKPPVGDQQRSPKPATPRIVAVSNQKGGVGKTTTAVNLAAALAQDGLGVLLIDMDPQGNASTALSIPHDEDDLGIYDVIIDGRPLIRVVKECPDITGLWCAPSTMDLAGAEIELVDMPHRERRLRQVIEQLYAALDRSRRPAPDYVVIDCPPSLGLLTLNALVAADEVFIPIQCEYYALEGLTALMRTIGLVQGALNPTLTVGAILLTMVDGRTNLAAQVADEVRAHFPAQVLRNTIPRSVRLSESPSFGQTVMTYDPTGTGALSYRAAAREYAHRQGGTHHKESAQ